MASPRQTLTFLMRRFEEAGIKPATRHGQNFLIDYNLLQLLADTAELGPQDVVLEVGTGTGALTAMLAERAGWVVTVELDRQLFQLAGEQLIDVPRLSMLNQDALRNKNCLAPQMLRAIQEQLEEEPGRHFKLVANLPYNIATPLISNFLMAETIPVSITVTIQKELADRIRARPGTKDYGALSVWIQSLCQVQLIRVIPPHAFWPRPSVSSAIIQIVPDRSKRQRIVDVPFFHGFVRAIFLHRRKLLRSGLLNASKKWLDKSSVDSILDDLQMPADVRAEQLDIQQMQTLAETVRQRVSS